VNSLEIRRYDMLVRVRDFGAAHAERFAPDSLAAQAFTIVAQAVASLSEHAIRQISGHGSARQATTTRAVARRALRGQLDTIARTAHAIGLDTPGVAQRFRIPRSGDFPLLAAARAFATDAAPLAAEFIAHALPPDFIVALHTGIAEFEAAIGEQEDGKMQHIAARAGIGEALATGLAAVRRLDAIVPNAFREEPLAVAGWRRARHVEYRRAAHKPDASTPAVAAADVAAAT